MRVEVNTTGRQRKTSTTQPTLRIGTAMDVETILKTMISTTTVLTMTSTHALAHHTAHLVPHGFLIPQLTLMVTDAGMSMRTTTMMEMVSVTEAMIVPAFREPQRLGKSDALTRMAMTGQIHRTIVQMYTETLLKMVR